MRMILAILHREILLPPSPRCQVRHWEFLFPFKQRLQLRAGAACSGRWLRLTVFDERKVLAKITRSFIQHRVGIRLSASIGVVEIIQQAVETTA
jgi:hypothetical protein